MDKDHDNNDDIAHPHDLTSNVSSTTWSAWCRKIAINEKMKLEELERKHRVEKELEELERKKGDLRRQEEVAKCRNEMKLSAVEAAEDEELDIFEEESNGSGGKLGQGK